MNTNAPLSENKTVEALKNLLSQIQADGGLINCGGVHTPVADPEWSNLGGAVYAAHEHLLSIGEESPLSIEYFDGDLDSYLDTVQ